MQQIFTIATGSIFARRETYIIYNTSFVLNIRCFAVGTFTCFVCRCTRFRGGAEILWNVPDSFGNSQLRTGMWARLSYLSFSLDLPFSKLCTFFTKNQRTSRLFPWKFLLSVYISTMRSFVYMLIGIDCQIFALVTLGLLSAIYHYHIIAL